MLSNKLRKDKFETPSYIFADGQGQRVRDLELEAEAMTHDPGGSRMFMKPYLLLFCACGLFGCGLRHFVSTAR